ncbi:hypothetical protein BH10PAT1_BH10PAT1_6620 [soil metagenome]
MLNKIIILLATIPAALGLVNKTTISPMPVPSVVSIAPAVSTAPVSVISPDGKATLTLRKTSNKDLVTYSFTSSAGVSFTRSLGTENSMSIPFNTWSTDNKYFFVQEENMNQNFFIVVLPNGESININDYFTQKFPDYKLQEVTGWASPTLLIVNANTGTADVSYWFEVTSKTFTRLSNRFN